MADGPKLTALGKIFIFLFVVLCGFGAYYFFTDKTPWGSSGKSSSPSSGGVFDSLGGGDQVQLGIAYGTEKQRWLEWAVQEFAKTRDGKRIKVNLIPMGSLEGAHALLNGDQRIQVWSPASALYEDTFVQEWQVKYSQNPILKEEALALSPMVFVMWDERYQAFLQKYKTVSFAAIGQALQEKGGWDAIAGKPEWGLFKFGHTHPNESNVDLKRPGRIDVKIPLFPTTTPREGFDLLRMLCKKRGLNLTDSSFASFESIVPPLLTPGAAEAPAVKIYRQTRTASASVDDDVLRSCLTDYQNPVPPNVMAFQIQIAASEATDLDFVPSAFRSDRCRA
jgi:hypothetical protein